jgi:uncharacterized membrane protein YfcA
MLPALLICATALLASGLTLISGFGLGTLLLPAFALFFPVPQAVAMTALVHFTNNLFKLALLGKHAHLGILLRFGLPAIPAAFLGAMLLRGLESQEPWLRYALAGSLHVVTPVKLCIALLMAAFALLELWPRFAKLSLPAAYMPLGGLLSGFFGGLSGHQGALRSIFLLRAGLGKEGFVATGVVLACLVDLTRLPVYAGYFRSGLRENAVLLAAAVLNAWIGAFFGSRLFRKTTLRGVQLTVAILLFLLSGLLGSGII